MDGMRKKEEIGYLNFLKIFATLAVIMIHVFSPIVSFHSNSLSDNEIIIGKIIRFLWQWSVPIFVMVTGSLLLRTDKNIQYNIVLKHYIPRIIYALFLFGIPFAWLEIVSNENTFNIFQLFNAFKNVLTGNLWDHMWYLYMIIGLYLFIPVIKIFLNNAKKNDIIYILFILFIFLSLMKFVKEIFGFSLGIQFPINSVYLFYLILGYYLSTIENRNKIIPFVFILFPICINILLAYNLIPYMTLENSFHYDSPLVVSMAIGIFMFFKRIKNDNKILKELAHLTFGVYLVHPLFINIIYKVLKITPQKYSLIIVLCITFPIVILSSFLFTYLVKKIRIIGNYIL